MNAQAEKMVYSSYLLIEFILTTVIERNILISGVCGNLGRVIARHYLKLNWNVYGYTRKGYVSCAHKSGSETSPKDDFYIFDDGYAMKLLACDPDDALNVSILINTMGGGGAHETWDSTSLDKWSDVYLSNVITPMNIAYLTSRHMKMKGYGRIVNIASVASLKPLAIGPEYSAAKAAYVNSTVSLAKDLTESGVTANCVSPGLIATNDVVNFIKKNHGDSIGSDNNFNHYVNANIFPSITSQLTTTKQILGIIEFLCSEYADNITGQNIVVDGGYSLL